MPNSMLDTFIKTNTDRTYRYTTLVRHKGTVVAFAMDDKRHIYYTVLDLSNTNGQRSAGTSNGAGSTNPNREDDTLDVNHWQNLQELRFPNEIAEVGYGVADQTLLPVFKKSSRIAEKPGTALPDEGSDRASGFDYFLSTTARFTADAPFQAFSDGQYLYIFRQAIAVASNDKASKDMVFVDRNGTLASFDSTDSTGKLTYFDSKGDLISVAQVDSAKWVSIVNSTLLVDRFVLAGSQLQTKMEVRFQRSRSKTRPASRKDSLGAEDLDGNPFLEPTQELKFVNNLWDGRFTVLLLPSQIAEIERWQIFVHNAKTKLIDSYSVERSQDGLFNTKGSQFYTSPDPKYQKDVFESKPGKDPFTGKELIPLVSESGEAESALKLNGSTDYLNLGNGVKLGSQFTLEAWIYPTRPPHTNPQPLITSQGSATDSRTNANAGPSVWIEGQTRLRIGFGNGQSWNEFTTRSILTPDAWNHIAVTFERVSRQRSIDGQLQEKIEAAYRVYVNGQLQEKVEAVNGYVNGTLQTEPKPDGTVSARLVALSTLIPADTAVKWFGAASNSFSGTIDEVRLWKRARSQRELQADRHQRLTGQELGLAGYWRFDESQGNTVYDQTDNQTHATLHGGTWVTSTAPVGEGMGVVRHSFQVASLNAANQSELRSIESGLTAVLYYQQIPVASGYAQKNKPLKQNARVMLAMATKTASGTKNEIASLDFAVSRAGKITQVPDVLPLAVINPSSAQTNKSLNQQLDEISDSQNKVRTLKEDLVNLEQAIKAISPKLDFLKPITSESIVDFGSLSEKVKMRDLGLSQDLIDKLGNFTTAVATRDFWQLQFNRIETITADATVTVYENFDYGGTSLPCKQGVVNDLALLNTNWDNKISSLKFSSTDFGGLTGSFDDTTLKGLAKPLQVTLYEHPNKTGKSRVFTEDTNKVESDGWNDITSSLNVELRAEYTTAIAAVKKKRDDEADKIKKILDDDVTPLRDRLQGEVNRLTASKTAKETELKSLGTTTDQLLETLKQGASVPMKLVATDAYGLTIAGGILGFAWTASGTQNTPNQNTPNQYTPLLFDSATGKLALYFRGVNDQFFVTYYDTETQRVQFALLDDSGKVQVQCAALSTELEMDSIVITVSDVDRRATVAEAERPNYCTVIITGPGFEETWNRVPRHPQQFADVLSGKAGDRDRLGFGTLTRDQGQLVLTLPDDHPLKRNLSAGTTLVLGKTKVTVKQSVTQSATRIPVSSPADSLPINDSLPIFYLNYDYAQHAQTTKVPSDLYNGSLLITAVWDTSVGSRATKITNQRVTSGSTKTSQWKAESPGYTLTFDGEKSYAQPKETARLQTFAVANDITLEAWVKPSNPLRKIAQSKPVHIIQQTSSNSNYTLGLQQLQSPPLTLNGQDQYMRVPLNDPETEVTHELWFKTSSPNCGLFTVGAGGTGIPFAYDRQIYLRGGNIKARIQSGLNLKSMVEEDEIITSINLNLADGEWHHVAHVFGTIDGAKGQRLYVDGKEVARGVIGTSDFDPSSLDLNEAILIGFSYHPALNLDFKNRYFIGQIDEVRVWNRVRTLAEIQSTMSDPLTGSEANLIGYWHFGEVTGTTVKDYSPGNHPATLYGAPQIGGAYLVAGVKNQLIQSSQTFPTNTWSHLAAVFRQSWGLKFDGTGGYLDCGNDATLDIRRDLTIEVLLKVTALTKPMLLLMKGTTSDPAAYSLTINTDGVLEFNPGSVRSTQGLQAGRFYKITVVRQYQSSTKNNGIGAAAFVSTKLGIDEAKSSIIRTHLKDDGYLIERRFETGYAVADKVNSPGIRDISALKTKLTIPDADWNAKEPEYFQHIRTVLTSPVIQVETTAGVSFYINQQPAGSSSSGGDVTGNDAALTIGGSPVNPAAYFNGVMSEVRLWNVALAKEAIALDIKGDEKGLVSWWRFEEKQGSTALDSKSQNHAKIKNTLQWVAEPDDPQSRLTLYHNGEEILAQSIASIPFQTSTSQFTLGALTEGSNRKNYFQGELEEVRIWKIVRTQEQIRDNLFRRLMGDQEDLVAYYTFDPAPDPESKTSSSAISSSATATNSIRITDHSFQSNHLEVPPLVPIDYTLALRSLESVATLPTTGQGLVIVAKIGSSYHMRAFNRAGEQILDKAIAPDAELVKQIDAALKQASIDAATQTRLLKQLSAVNPYILSTAPISDDTPQVRSALAGIKTAFSGTIQSQPAVQEYGDMQYDSAGNLIGVFKRCYSFIKDNHWHLITGFKVGDLLTEWVGQVQYAPQMIGYIEGAPPVPSENLTAIAGKLSDYARASSIELVQAESTTYNYTASKSGGFDMQVDFKVGGISETSAEMDVPLFDTQLFKMGYTFGLQGKFEHSTGWLSEAVTGVGRTKTNSSKLSLRGTAENPDAIAYPTIGRRFVPTNVGLALVKSDTADVFALRLKHNSALISFQMRPNPDIPPDWNLITFPINPRYIKQGSLDGKVGFNPDRNYPNALSYSPDSSYFKPIQAYALKDRINREAKENQTNYAQFDAVAKGSAVPTPGLQQPGELQQLPRRGDLQDKPGSRLPQFQKRNLVNTYVWTADGGLFAESEDTLDAYQEKLNGTYAFKSSAGVYGEFKLAPAWFPGPNFSANALFGGRLNMSVTKAQDSKTTFSLKVDVDKVESDIFIRKANGDLEMDLTDPLNPKPKRQPGRVDAYRFMSFYLEPKADYFDTFFNQVVDPIWIEQSDDPNAAALREARQETKKPPCWRILHRVTYVSRILPTFDDNAPPSLEKTLRTLDINSNYELIKQLEPFVSNKLGSYAEFSDAIDDAVTTYLPELQPHLPEIKQYMSLYFGMLDGSLPTGGDLEQPLLAARVANQPPLVSAGQDQTVGLNGSSIKVELEGSAISDDRFPREESIFVTWEPVGSAEGVQLINPHADPALPEKPTAVFTQRGKYTLQLTANDGSLSASDQRTITVNTPPKVNAGGDRTLKPAAASNLTTLKLEGVLEDDGLGDPKQGTIKVKWTQVPPSGRELTAAEQVVFADATDYQTLVTFKQSGHYLLRLTVDNGSFSVNDEVTIAVGARVTEGLQHLYTFKAGQGNEIADVSGVAEPLDLVMQDASSSAVDWVANQSLKLKTPTLLKQKQEQNPATRLINAVKASNEITVEAWIEPAAAQNRLSRIVTLSSGLAARNFILGQAGNQYHFGLRTTQTNLSASDRPLTAGTVVPNQLTHVVCTRDTAGLVRLYVNGAEVANRRVGGDFSNWDNTFTLMLGNESEIDTGNGSGSRNGNGSGDRAWVGTYHLLAIYSRALSPAEIQQNYQFTADKNLPPIVSAGANQVINQAASPTQVKETGVRVPLAGKVTNDRPSPKLSHRWTKVSGPGDVQFEHETDLTTAAIFKQKGIYVLRLTVDDGELTTSNEVTITVNHQPEVDAGSSQHLNRPNTLQLVGRLNDKGFDDAAPRTLTTEWSKVSGPGTVGFTPNNALTTTAQFSQYGPYVLRLTATTSDANNNQPLSSSDDVTIYVHDVPNIRATSPQSVITLSREGKATIVLAGEIIGGNTGLGDPQGTVTTEWSQVSGPAAIEFQPNQTSLQPTAQFTANGEYTLRFTVNNGHLSAYKDVAITVNRSPIVNAGDDQTITLPAGAELDGTVGDDGLPSDPGRVTVQWSKVSGPTSGEVRFTNPTEVYTQAIFSTPGNYVLRLTANDGTGPVSDDVTVAVLLPLAFYTFKEKVGTTVTDLAEPRLNLTFTSGARLTGNALIVESSTIIQSAGAATKIINKVKEKNELTIEAWVKPTRANQGNTPGRIVTLSPDINNRNVSLQQGVWDEPNNTTQNAYGVLLRTTQTNNNGGSALKVSKIAPTRDRVHLVYTRDSSGNATIYINGEAQASGTVTGDFSTWDNNYRLAFANELTGDRPWLGEYYLVAIYARALTEIEVKQNYNYIRLDAR
ncbi:hypothetical protein K9N68_25580 [Kovacikia minuta CCNUW1]|uniref:LamG-like jellyroll fold domain-containing protein n=1 Tax=Kovacikia minuta TaxID=2931930 RepID=UPI001CCED461|nr:LamG-like jellyroll fold domain-containing protein [Kovacikia minuta]UBF24983.1 hypothetical protein K9N68_25580 [Kovacikia minuta CCNUW1]